MSSEDQEETEAEEAARYEKLAQEWGEPYVDLDRYKPEAKALAMLPEGLVRQHGVLPLKKDGMILYVALSDTNDLQALACRKIGVALHGAGCYCVPPPAQSGNLTRLRKRETGT